MNHKGNQKHLTFEQRVDIEKGLTENKSFAEIGRMIGKAPSTISKEIRLHAHTKERPDAEYTNPPCIYRKTCKIVCLCNEQCGTFYKICRKPDMQCIKVWPGCETAECKKLKKPPYVCNGCGKRRIVLCQENFIHQNMLTMNTEVYWLIAGLVSIILPKAFKL
nr:helix-turn-helix domain-containing protein [Hungatella effluvii]